jgi:hypothetical protein
MAASLSDDDLGYPDRVAFIPGDQEWVDDALWRNLTEGRATVLVSDAICASWRTLGSRISSATRLVRHLASMRGPRLGSKGQQRPLRATRSSSAGTLPDALAG